MTTKSLKHWNKLSQKHSNTSGEINKWKDTTWSCIGNLNSINLSMFPKLIYSSNMISINKPRVSPPYQEKAVYSKVHILYSK